MLSGEIKKKIMYEKKISTTFYIKSNKNKWWEAKLKKNINKKIKKITIKK